MTKTLPATTPPPAPAAAEPPAPAAATPSPAYTVSHPDAAYAGDLRGLAFAGGRAATDNASLARILRDHYACRVSPAPDA